MGAGRQARGGVFAWEVIRASFPPFPKYFLLAKVLILLLFLLCI